MKHYESSARIFGFSVLAMIVILIGTSIWNKCSAQSHQYIPFTLMVVSKSGDIQAVETVNEVLTITNKGGGIYSMRISGRNMKASNENTSSLKYSKAVWSQGVQLYEYYDTRYGEWFLTFRSSVKLSELARGYNYSGAVLSLEYATEPQGFVMILE